MHMIQGMLILVAAIHLCYFLLIGFLYSFKLAHLYLWALAAAGFTALALLNNPFIPVCLIAIYLAFVIAALSKLLPAMQKPDNTEATRMLLLGVEKKFHLLYLRCEKAISLLRERPELCAVLSGGMGEAETMRDILLSEGIAPDRLILESQSTTTLENMYFCSEILPTQGRTVIVTNNFHAWRAMYDARSAGFQDVFCMPAHTPAILLPHCLLREILAFYLRVMRRILTISQRRMRAIKAKWRNRNEASCQRTYPHHLL